MMQPHTKAVQELASKVDALTTGISDQFDNLEKVIVDVANDGTKKHEILQRNLTVIYQHIGIILKYVRIIKSWESLLTSGNFVVAFTTMLTTLGVTRVDLVVDIVNKVTNVYGRFVNATTAAADKSA